MLTRFCGWAASAPAVIVTSMLNEFLDLERWLQWFSALDREFVFLLALPFVVAIVGLWSAWLENEPAEQEDRAPEAGARPASRERGAPPERRQRVRRREDLGRLAPQQFR
jgi:hypothetical protein